MHKKLDKILRVAITSRVVLFMGQYVSNCMFEDFDTSNSITLQYNKSFQHVLSGINNWDSIYFNHITTTGYTYEQMLAFMPAYPYIVTMATKLIYLPNEVFYIQIIGFVLNLFLFPMACYYLFQLTILVSNDTNMASIATIGFIFNPANIFLMSSYSESFFVCLQFALLYYMESKSYFIACVLINITMITRFNGVINIFFLIHYLLKHKLEGRKDNSIVTLLLTVLELRFVVKLAVYLIASFTLFILWHVYVYSTYCKQSYPTGHWCNWKIPLSYAYIQQNYWNVGFLRYYELKQLPNFVLAFPVMLLLLRALSTHLINNRPLEQIKYLGLIDHTVQNKYLGLIDHTVQIKYLGLIDHTVQNKAMIKSPSRIFVYLVHATFLLMSGMTSFHVQILTRMICSSSPVIYWTFGDVILQYFNSRTSYSKTIAKLLLVYFLLYNVLGLVLHCNFYPWT